MMGQRAAVTAGKNGKNKLFPKLGPMPRPILKGNGKESRFGQMGPFLHAFKTGVGKNNDRSIPFRPDNGIVKMERHGLRPCGLGGAGKTSVKRQWCETHLGRKENFLRGQPLS